MYVFKWLKFSLKKRKKNYDFLLLKNCHKKGNKHNGELQRADPGTKVEVQFSTRGHIFPHDAQNEFSLFSSF